MLRGGPIKPKFFPTPERWRQWLEKQHEKERELWVGFYKRASGKPSITWPEAVDQALCFGWIDGIRKSLDDVSYVIRFTQRRAGSIWSAVNLRRVNELIKLGLIRPAGLAAFQRFEKKKSSLYSYEQRKTAQLSAAEERRFRSHPKAWAFFETCPPWYRRTTAWWVISAKKEETRAKRLAILIEDSSKERSIAPLRRKAK